jgi:hypothetical protein
MYILSNDWDSSENPQAVSGAHKKYDAYLKKNKGLFPASAYEFSTADWHHNFRDHKALHDSWLASIVVTESGENDERTYEIKVRLFGAFHDGYLNLLYKGVKSYQVGSSTNEHTALNRDEVRLSERGYVLHEIEWWQSASWVIECEDILFEWEST